MCSDAAKTQGHLYRIINNTSLPPTEGSHPTAVRKFPLTKFGQFEKETMMRQSVGYSQLDDL